MPLSRKELAQSKYREHQWSMKSPRAVLVGGICFLLGMIFCYFLMTQLPGPQMGNIAMNQVQPAPAPVPPPMPGLPSDGLTDEQVVVGTRTEERIWYYRNLQGIAETKRQLPPKGDGRRHRIVPARAGDTVDMIDLDFKIDLDSETNGPGKR